MLPTGFAGTATIEVFPWIGVAATLAIGSGEGVLTAPLAEHPFRIKQTSARAQITFGRYRIRSPRRRPALLLRVYSCRVNEQMSIHAFEDSTGCGIAMARTRASNRRGSKGGNRYPRRPNQPQRLLYTTFLTRFRSLPLAPRAAADEIRARERATLRRL